jgi:ribosomal protein S12 methylthiotransferase
MQQPRIGFVSSAAQKPGGFERILTELRTEGYDVVPSYDADMVIVNTCGFIDSAVQESLEAIGEALKENGKVIVTGCLVPKKIKFAKCTQRFWKSPAHTAAGAGTRSPLRAETTAQPVPEPGAEQGVKLTPRHYAYLKISEGCNHRCAFCIIPSCVAIWSAVRLANAGGSQTSGRCGREDSLVISQDTSAYGVDVKHRTGFHNGEPVKTSMESLCEQLSKLGVWVRLHYVYPYPHVDNVIPLMAEGKILPYLDIPLQHASPRILVDETPRLVDRQLANIKQWREICPELTLRSTFIVGFPGETEEDFRCCSTS